MQIADEAVGATRCNGQGTRQKKAERQSDDGWVEYQIYSHSHLLFQG